MKHNRWALGRCSEDAPQGQPWHREGARTWVQVPVTEPLCWATYPGFSMCEEGGNHWADQGRDGREGLRRQHMASSLFLSPA